jgi:hypothetical protein
MMPHDRRRGSWLDYPRSVPTLKAGRLCCSLSSSIPAPAKPVPSASTVASPLNARPARLRLDAEQVCPCPLAARRAASRGEKSGMLASSRCCAAANCGAHARSPLVHRIRPNASTRRSARAACGRSASRSSRVSTGRFSAASASTHETAANGQQHPPLAHRRLIACHSEPAGDESRCSATNALYSRDALFPSMTSSLCQCT